MTIQVMLGVAARVTLVLGAAAAVDVVLLRRRGSAAGRHLLWALTLSGTLLLPLLTVALPGWRVVPLPLAWATSPMSGTVRAATPPGPQIAAPRGTADASSAPGRSAGHAPTEVRLDVEPAASMRNAAPAQGRGPKPHPAVSMYLAGVFLLLLKIALDHLRVRRLARGASNVGEWAALVRSVESRLPLRRRVLVLRSRGSVMPFTWGLVRPQVLLPAEAAGWPESRRRAVLLHELAHVARHDCLTQTLAALACALYWPHPGVWWAAARMRLERELACDDAVVRSGVRAREYARDLLALASVHRSPRLRAAAVSVTTVSQLETRLRALIDERRNRGTPDRHRAIAATIAATAVILTVSTLRAGGAPLAAAAMEEVDGAPPAAMATPTATGSADSSVEPAPGVGLEPAEDAAAQEFGGEWTVRLANRSDPVPDAGKLHFALRAPGLNTFYEDPARVEGLTPAQIVAGGPARFQLRRDAGTFHFEGSFERGRGTGHFRFTPDPDYGSALVRRGVRGLTPRGLTPEEQFSMARHDVSLAFVDELLRQGYTPPSATTLEKAGLTSADQDYLRRLDALGYRLGTLEAVLRLANSSLSMEQLAALHSLGYAGIPIDELISLTNHSITPEQVRMWNAEAGQQLTVTALLDRRARATARPGAPPASTAAARTPTTDEPAASTPLAGRWVAASSTNAAANIDLRWDDNTNWHRWFPFNTLDGLDAERVHTQGTAQVVFALYQDAGNFLFEGAFTRGSGSGQFTFVPNRGFAATLRALGVVDVAGVTDHQLKNLAYGGMSAAAIRDFRELGLTLTLREVVDLAIYQVTPAYARELQAANVVDGHTVRGLIDLRHQGVPAEYVRDLHALGYHGLTPRQLVNLRRADVTAAFIRSVQAGGTRTATPEELIRLRRGSRD